VLEAPTQLGNITILTGAWQAEILQAVISAKGLKRPGIM
jgi:hypothetical protein